MTDELGKALLSLARNAIAAELRLTQLEETEAPALDRPGASFVTLTVNQRLRGCIGTLEARRPLRQDVRANACAAAFRDPRFQPLSVQEFARIRVEVSLLTAAQPMTVASEADLLRQLRAGVDGLIFEMGKHRSTFLPQVWEDLPEPRQFLAQLKLKAGLPPDFWSAGIRLSRYQAQKWKEEK